MGTDKSIRGSGSHFPLQLVRVVRDSRSIDCRIDEADIIESELGINTWAGEESFRFDLSTAWEHIALLALFPCRWRRDYRYIHSPLSTGAGLCEPQKRCALAFQQVCTYRFTDVSWSFTLNFHWRRFMYVMEQFLSDLTFLVVGIVESFARGVGPDRQQPAL